MENNPSNLHESLWRRQPTDAERDELRTQPELELEARLTETLVKIPNAVVPSNFTARVLDAVELEAAREARTRNWTLNWRALWPRVAVAATVLIFAGMGFQRYEAHVQRAKLAKNIAMVTATQPPPSVDVLENLDVIQRMSQSGHADSELLAALQ